MKINVENIKKLNSVIGVPDSQLKALCNCLYNEVGISKQHIIAANEGNAVGLAAGTYLATGEVPVLYLQNSGLGNIVNPVASLLNPAVYGIPCIFIVGWRGEPGVHDEPQHVYQGKITLELLKDLSIEYMVVDKETTQEDINKKMESFNKNLEEGNSVAFVIKKGALEYDGKVSYKNNYEMKREDILKELMDVCGNDVIVSTTGKTSREIFEIREARGQDHSHDFLTVGSMGHSSSIALGIAIKKPNKRVWCIDGDGAMLMHMGSMAVIGTNKPNNYVHILINNEAHESVGGMPTVAGSIDPVAIAKACSYEYAKCVDNREDLLNALEEIKNFKGLVFLEVKAAIGSRDDLGRPTTTPQQNKEALMKFLKED